MLRVTPIYGSISHDPSSPIISPTPVSTIIEYASLRILVDIGWDESCSYLYTTASTNKNTNTSNNVSTKQHRKVSNQDNNNNNNNNTIITLLESEDSVLFKPKPLDYILLSNSTIHSIGGLAMLYKIYTTNNQPLPTIYATFPSVKMGQMTLYDYHANISLDGGNVGWDLEDVDVVFSLIHTLKYSQNIMLHDTSSSDSNKKAVISLAAHRSGCVVGGCFWILKRLVDETEVVICTMYHHAKEKHLASSELLKFGVSADVLITRVGGPNGILAKLYEQPSVMDGSVGKRNGNSHGKAILSVPMVTRAEGELIELVMSALRRGGNVLLPVDTSGRVLELLLLLSRHWEKNRLSTTYNLCWVGSMTVNTIDYARSQLEWMAESLGQQFDSNGRHPFALKAVHILSSISQLDAVEKQSSLKNNVGGSLPMVVLASGSTLDHGPARDLFLRWADNPDHAIILTDYQRCAVPRLPNDIYHYHSKNYEDSNVVDAMIGTNSDIIEDPNADVGAHHTDTAHGTVVEPNTTDGEGHVNDTVLTQPSVYTTAAQLLYKWCQAKYLKKEMEDVILVDALHPHRAPLSGKDLQLFNQEEERMHTLKREEEEKQAMLREVELARGRLRLGIKQEDTSNTGTSKEKEEQLPTSTNQLQPNKKQKTSRFDSTLFFKFSKPLYLTFAVREEAVGILGQPDSIAKYGVGESVGYRAEGEYDLLEDDYGIAVLKDRFLDIVTGVDPNKYNQDKKLKQKKNNNGLGFSPDGRPVLPSSTTGANGLPNIISDDIININNNATSDTDITTTNTSSSSENELALEAADLSEGNGILRARNGRPPLKVTTIPKPIEVLAEISYVPLEGLINARAARQYVRALQPRQVVILGGNAGDDADTDDIIDTAADGDLLLHQQQQLSLNHLRRDAITLLNSTMDENSNNITNNNTLIDLNHIFGWNAIDNVTNTGEAALLADVVREFTLTNNNTTTPSSKLQQQQSVFLPHDYQTDELDVGHAAYSVRLMDTPYNTSTENDNTDTNPETTDEPYEAKMGDYTVSLIHYIATGQKVASDGSIVLAPFPTNNNNTNHTTTQKKQPQKSVMISNGEVLLSDLRSEIIAQGMKAEYTAHALEGYQQILVNNKIIIKKNQGERKIDVDGPLCEDFWIVRNIVCSQYVTL